MIFIITIFKNISSSIILISKQFVLYLYNQIQYKGIFMND